MSEFDDTAQAALERPVHQFWRCRFPTRCPCGPEGEPWMGPMLHPRVCSSQVTRREPATKLKRAACDQRSPEIRIPGSEAGKLADRQRVAAIVPLVAMYSLSDLFDRAFDPEKDLPAVAPVGSIRTLFGRIDHRRSEISSDARATPKPRMHSGRFPGNAPRIFLRVDNSRRKKVTPDHRIFTRRQAQYPDRPQLFSALTPNGVKVGIMALADSAGAQCPRALASTPLIEGAAVSHQTFAGGDPRSVPSMRLGERWTRTGSSVCRKNSSPMWRIACRKGIRGGGRGGVRCTQVFTDSRFPVCPVGRANSGRSGTLSLATLLSLLLPLLAAPARAADAVGEWVAVVDQLDGGQMRRYTLSILFPAIHDALNAIQPRYSRWTRPAAGEPRGIGASPEAAIATVAHEVLTRLGQGRTPDREAPYAAAMARVPVGPARDAGVALGRAVANAALQRRELDGYAPYSSFSASSRPWHWRPTPTDFQRDVLPTSGPLLFTPTAAAALIPAPPTFGSATYRRDNEQVRRIGRRDRSDRTAYQTSAALFWANQVSHRGFMDAAVTLLEERGPADGLWGSARLLAVMAIAMDDAAVIIWQAKERHSVWRPVTALQLGGGGATPDPDWLPLINTPPFPEYPSGHATDCAAGAAVMTAFFGASTPFTYRSLGVQQTYSQRYSSFAEASHECSQSRIWAGVHWPNTEEVSEQIGAAIGRQALTHMVPLVRPTAQGFAPSRGEQGRP